MTPMVSQPFQVKNIFSGSSSSLPSLLTNVNGTIFFVAFVAEDSSGDRPFFRGSGD
jgi:hypothetical protein